MSANAWLSPPSPSSGQQGDKTGLAGSWEQGRCLNCRVGAGAGEQEQELGAGLLVRARQMSQLQRRNCASNAIRAATLLTISSQCAICTIVQLHAGRRLIDVRGATSRLARRLSPPTHPPPSAVQCIKPASTATECESDANHIAAHPTTLHGG